MYLNDTSYIRLHKNPRRTRKTRTFIKVFTKSEKEVHQLAEYLLSNTMSPPLVGDDLILPTRKGEDNKKTVFTVVKRRFPVPPPDGTDMVPEIWLIVE